MLDNFLALPRVGPLLQLLHSQPGEDGEQSIYLHGPAGSGKSHLLQSCCQGDEAATLYLPLAQLREYAPDDVLQGVEAQDRLCLDDLDSIAGDPAWERALFNLCNLARQRGCRMVFAAASAPRTLGVALPDLASRLSWGVVFQLPRLQDADKSAILQFRAQRRGLALSPAVADFIVPRAPRDMHKLLELLEELDQASLAQKRALSIPFVKKTLDF
jgi:DnaA family protein